MSDINWKTKYEAIKARYMESVDVAFRLGYEQGQQQATMDQMQQQQQQEAEQAAAGGGMDQQDPNAQPQEGEQQAQPAPDSAHPGGSELDQHISQLESMLGKGEVEMNELMKSVAGLRKLQKSIKLEVDLKKSAAAIPEIAKALHKPKFKISAQANHNMSNSAKHGVNMQEEILKKVMKSWQEEEQKTGKDILSVLHIEGITKRE